MNTYGRLSHMKADVAGVTGADQDAIYLRALAAESREFEKACGGRFFYTLNATRHYDTRGGACLWLPDYADIISITSLKFDEDGDGVYELTLTEGTDFWLWPESSGPKRRIDLNTDYGSRSSFPVGRRRVQVVGKFGHSEEWESTTITGTVASTSGTTLTASADASAIVYPGDMIKVEDEQMYVSAVVTTAITVERGVNGTTAATHSAAAITIRRYPRDIEQAIRARAVAGRWDNNQGMPLGEVGRGYNVDYAKYMSVVRHYRLVSF